MYHHGEVSIISSINKITNNIPQMNTRIIDKSMSDRKLVLHDSFYTLMYANNQHHTFLLRIEKFSYVNHFPYVENLIKPIEMKDIRRKIAYQSALNIGNLVTQMTLDPYDPYGFRLRIK